MNLLKKILTGTLDKNVFKRIVNLFISFLIIFYITMIVSFLILPEGILRGKHPIVNLLELSPNIWLLTLRILLYNLIFTCLLVASSLIVQKSKIVSNKYIPISYITFWGILVNFGIILGTWSFGVNKPSENFPI